jgi:diphthamide biosynthesis methyltransferase
MAAARSQKKNELHDYYTKCLAKKKTNHLKARTQQQQHQETSREETRRKNQQMLSQANKIKISL